MIRLTREQVRQIDHAAINRFHIPGIVLMENAARAATHVAMEMLGANRTDPVLILCGGGNNGGDGLAIARHLHNRRVPVQIMLTIDATKYAGDAWINHRIVSEMMLPTGPVDLAEIKRGKWALIIDAIFGTGLSQAPRDPFPAIVQAVEAARAPVLAIDVPSGLDCDTGLPLGACIRASRTITFVAEKIGFANKIAMKYLGQVTVGDIGAPRELLERHSGD